MKRKEIMIVISFPGIFWIRTMILALSLIVAIHPILALVAAASPSKISLTYFDIEGVAEPIRLAFLLSHQQFDDIRIPFPEWQEMKSKMPYGQLPVMSINDGPFRTQSRALLRYVGSTCSSTLYPTDKLLDIEEVIGVLEDMQQCLRSTMAVQKIGFPDGFYETEEGKEVKRALREKFVETDLPKYLGYLTNMIIKNTNCWLASVDEPTIADCLAIPFLRSLTRGNLDYIPSTCLETHPDIVQYVKRFCSLDPIKGRYDSGLY
jgi:prostaglandin-H2 D-isomerase / glutathione transferase